MSAAKVTKKSNAKPGKKTQAKSKTSTKTSTKASAKNATKTTTKKSSAKRATKATGKVKSSKPAKISFRTTKRAAKQTKAEKGAKRGAKTRKQIKFFVSILSILVLNLSLNIVNKLIKWQTGTIDAYWLTAIGMVIVLMVFFPAIAMKYYVNIVTEWIWKLTIHLSSRILQKRPAIFVVFFITLFILYVGFYWVWFDKFIFEESFTKMIKFFKN